jgi:hypothetical protein
MAASARAGYRRSLDCAGRAENGRRHPEPPLTRHMAHFRMSLLLLSALITQPAMAQLGAFSQSPGGDARAKTRGDGAQVECGPIGCRPLPPGCRQVRLGGGSLDNNGLQVICDRKRN